jgi:hypothetical protein
MEAANLSNTRTDRGFIPPTTEASPPVESEALSRFEGEGGREAPTDGLVVLPLDKIVGEMPPNEPAR